ncbi:unnamed protein product [Phytophthora fragariaefolia]|uniref:Unnamed protein product n=1 Tax=Phytophthora fragariaefolia TaxID=1490495 RepID=A0A9W6U984_9STRA|nr:unnamed protein product [Phytophthora fragariaefolia]
MQFEMQQANAPAYTNDAASYKSEQSATQGQQPVVSREMESGYSRNQISQSHSYEYAQALAKAQEQEQASNSARATSFSTQRSSTSGDISFQSLMESQNQGYGCYEMQQQQQNTPTRTMNMQNLQMGNQFYSTSSMMTPTSQSFPSHSNVSEMTGQSFPRNMMEAHHHQLGSYQMQQQQQQQQQMHSARSQSRVTTFQEFTAQIQHLDKSVLIELLWNQRSALARWQNQAKQLELQLSVQQSAVSSMGAGFHSPMASGGAFASHNIAAEAEMQRARERSNSRMMQSQQQMPNYAYSQQSTPSNSTYSQADGAWADNPQLYWQRIRVLKTAYENQLRTAQRALAHNVVPPNSMYSMKAQSMIQNIGMVLNILNEPPTNVQPRKFEVLDSIERFMQVTVVPIVQKVLSSRSTPQAATGSQPVVASGSSPAIATSVSTYSPGVKPSEGNVVGMPNNVRQDTDNQYSGPRWASSNSIFSEIDTPRQPSRGMFADDTKGSTRTLDGLTAVENSPNDTGYEPAGYASESDKLASQSSTSIGQSMVYEAPTMTLKDSSNLSLPALESRPSTLTDSHLTSGATLSPGSSTRDSSGNKVMDSASVDDDFSDFPVLEFDDPVADGNSFVKENNPSNASRKRGIEDV